MQSSGSFQWWSGSPGQSDTPDGRSHLLLLLLRATHGCSGVGGLSREAANEDAIVDTVVSPLIELSVVFTVTSGFLIYNTVSD
jgi:hypothetical protein